MDNYKIFVDLSADLTVEVANKYEVGFVPMQYSVNGVEFTASYIESEENLKNFYDAQRRGEETKTTQINPYFYEEFFEEYAKKGEGVLYFTLSSGLSNTYNSAVLAKKTLLEKYPDFKFEIVDSLTATGGIALLVHEAGENKEKGVALEENAKLCAELVKKLRIWLEVEDLMYLKRGGRVSGAAAVIGSALKLKPTLTLNGAGKLETIDKIRGAKKAMNYLVEKFKTLRDESRKIVYVVHTDNLEGAEYIKSLLLEVDSALDVKICMMTPIIGAHTGPGMTALCFAGSTNLE